MRAVFAGYPSAASDAARILLSASDVDQGAAPGTEVGTLSVSAPGLWRFALADDAGGRYALSGDRIVVGAVSPDPVSMAAPKILVAASDGSRAIGALLSTNVRHRLPSLPLPLGARVVLHGDSQSGWNNWGGVSLASDRAAPSYAFGAVETLFGAHPRFDVSSWFDEGDPWRRLLAGANQGLFGDHLQWTKPDFGNGIVPRLGHTIARNAPIVILQGGTNSLNSGDDQSGVPASAAYVIARLDEALRICRRAGRWCILETLLPRGDWPAADPRQSELVAVNAWIRSQSGRDGVLGIWDSWDVLAPGGQLDPSMFIEGGAGIHRNQRGAYAAAFSGAASLQSILLPAVSPGSVFNQDPVPSNLLGAGTANLAGTTGTKIGIATTGAVASGCSLRMIRGGSTQVASKEGVSGALTRQVLTITPVNDGLNGGYHISDFTLPALTTDLPPAGAFLQAGIFVEIGDTPSISHTVLTTTVLGGATSRLVSRAMFGNTNTFRAGGPGNRSFWVVSKPFQLPVASTFDRITMVMSTYLRLDASDVPVIRYSRPWLRVVPDPRPAWGYAV